MMGYQLRHRCVSEVIEAEDLTGSEVGSQEPAPTFNELPLNTKRSPRGLQEAE